MKTKHLVNIIMFGVVTGDDDVIPPFIFPQSLRHNTETDIVPGKESAALDR